MCEEERLKKNRSFWKVMMGRDMSSRHSMIETGSQRSLDRSSVSSVGSVSQTSGSLDRLTASSHRHKPPKSSFFRLKPKTPTFWKPLFQPVVASNPHVSLPYISQYTQTDLTPTVEFGVQVAEGTASHTRDVPVQTCPTWDADLRFRLNIAATQTNDTTPFEKLDQTKSNELNLATSVNTLTLLSASIPQATQIQEILPQAESGVSEMAEIELDFNTLPLTCGTTPSSRFSSIRNLDTNNALSKLKDDFEQLRNDFGLDLDIKHLEKRSNLKISPDFEILRGDFSIPTSLIEKEESRPYRVSPEVETVPHVENCNPIGPDNNCLEIMPSSGQMAEQETDQVHPNCSSPSASDKVVDSGCCTSEIMNSLSSSTDILSCETLVFDSCENLDQLEDEIIRSLYTPIQESDCCSTADDDAFNNCDHFVVNNNSVSKMSTEPSSNIKTLGSALQQLYTVNEREKIENIPTVPQTNTSSNADTIIIEDSIQNEAAYVQNQNLSKTDEVFETVVELPTPNQKKIFANSLEVRKAWSTIEPQIPSPVLEVDEPITTPDTSGKCSPVDTITKTYPLDPEAATETNNNKSVEDASKTVVTESYIILNPPQPPPEPNSSKPVTFLPESNPHEPEEKRFVTPPPPPPLPPNSNPTSTHSPNSHINSSRLVSRSPTPNNDGIPNSTKSPMVLELEQKFQNRRKIASELEEVTKKIAKNIQTNGTTMPAESKSTWIPGKGVHVERKISADRSQSSPVNNTQHMNGRNDNGDTATTSPSLRYSPSKQHPTMNGGIELSFAGEPIITSEPPPLGAVLVDEKVTVDGNQIHTDTYYAIPVKEVLKEKKSTTKFIPAPEKYEGIGPTEEGIPVSLRQSVKKENMSDWYKTMYNTLHKIDNKDDTYVIGYTSDPEIRKEDKCPPPPKYGLLNSNSPRSEKSLSPVPQVSIHRYPTKHAIEVYNAHPRPIEDFEPGYSSVTDNNVNIGSKRYFPTNKPLKTSYEFRDGYESESSIFKKSNQPDELEYEEQKTLYREIQHGGEIPQFGLRKPAPMKFKEPVVGPLPTPPSNFESYPQATRPETLPSEYLNNNEGELGQANGIYANQMRHAIHTELQQKGFQMSPSSPNSMTIRKPVVKSPQKKLLARTLYDFSAETPKEISLKKDDIVVIHRELDKNWYEGERKGLVGIFPVSYVEVLPPEHASPTPKKLQEGSAKVLYDFFAHNSVELNAKKGDEMRLIRKVDSNWYEGRIGSKKGIIPCSYIKVIQEPGFDSNQNRQSPISPSLKIQNMSSVTPTSESSLSTHSKSNGSVASHNGYGHQFKKGNKLIEPALYRALYKYSPQNADELQLMEGDDVYIIEICDDGWFVGTSVRTGELGIIPGNYMEKVW